MQSAASDLSLLEAAAREAGGVVRELLTKPLEIKSKGQAGPVTNIDFAIDVLLAERLLGARPDYGWLSEETPDDPARRVGKRRVFMLDPIDGTAAMIGRVPEFTISVGITESDRAWAGVVYNPMTDAMFLGAIGHGATLNGKPMHTSAQAAIEGMRMIAPRVRFADKRWKTPWPKMQIEPRQSIALRMALVAAGHGDATVLFGFKNEWDIAAGAALVAAAGGRVTDPWGEELAFNGRDPRAPGVVAAGAGVHPLIIERTRDLPDPRQAGET